MRHNYASQFHNYVVVEWPGARNFAAGENSFTA